MNDNDILKAEHARREAGTARARRILHLVTDGVRESQHEARVARMRQITDPAVQHANELGTDALIAYGIDREVAAAITGIVLHATTPTIAQAVIATQGVS